MSDQFAYSKLQKIHQEHLLNHFEQLSAQSKQALLESIDALDAASFLQQRKLLTSPTKELKTIIPFTDYQEAGNPEDTHVGEKLIADGKVGCLLIAGGQGTRLQFNGPKGCFPVTIVKHKTLFQLFAEKVKAAGQQAQRPLQLAIMTSPLNDQVTKDFFESNNFFGLERSQVSFFVQGMLPFLDQQGDLFLETEEKIAVGPDGNGRSLKYFVEQGAWEQWQKQGITIVNFIQIDNPLADPFDANLIGFHARQKNEATLKCIERHNPEEKVGIVTKVDGKVSVIEYTEISKEEQKATVEGKLKHPCANISLFAFSIDFIKVASQHSLPLHFSLKATSALGENRMAWKSETFIFDNLAFANKVGVLVYPRERCFAPLKNGSGPDSLETVQQALQNEDERVIKEAIGRAPQTKPFELSQEFYYPTPDLKSKWEGSPLPHTGYIA